MVECSSAHIRNNDDDQGPRNTHTMVSAQEARRWRSSSESWISDAGLFETLDRLPCSLRWYTTLYTPLPPFFMLSRRCHHNCFAVWQFDFWAKCSRCRPSPTSCSPHSHTRNINIVLGPNTVETSPVLVVGKSSMISVKMKDLLISLLHRRTRSSAVVSVPGHVTLTS